MFYNYFISAIRTIKNNKIYSIINILGLSIGLASVILILLWVNDEMSYDLFHTQKDNIYRVLIDNEGEKGSTVCGALAPSIKKEIPEISEVVRFWTPNPWQLYYNDKNIERMGNYADPSVFNIFSFKFLKGDKKTALQNHHSVVITKSVATSLFENIDAVGKIIYIRNRFGEKEAFSVTGVIQDVPKNSHIQFDFLFSYTLLRQWYRNDFGERWTNYSFTTYALVKEKSNLSVIDKKIKENFERHTNKKRLFFLQPLRDVYLNDNISEHTGGNYSSIKLFIGIVFLILLVACINYVNLATAYSSQRSKEIGLKKVIGASRLQISLYQFFEPLLYAFAALIIALMIIYIVQPLFVPLTGKDISIDYSNTTFIISLIGITLFTGIVAGYYPAVFLSSFKPISALNVVSKGNKPQFSFRTLLIVFQFTFTTIMIVATLVTSNQMNFIKKKDLGFSKDNLIFTWTSGFNNDVIRQELLKNPNILNVAASGAQLDRVLWWQNIKEWEGKKEEQSVQYGILEVDHNFMDTYGIKLSKGRFYSKEFPSDEDEAIVINKSAVKAMKMDDPIGKTIFFNGTNRYIVGIVEDFHWESLHSNITPLLFVLYPKQLRCLGIKVKNENIAEILPQIKKVISHIEPDYFLEYKFLDEVLYNQYTNDQRRNSLYSLFSTLSIVLSCMGLFGLTSFIIQKRTKEIGIRKVLGASVQSIVFMISKDFIKLILIANLLAWPTAYYFMNKWLQNFAYRIELDWWSFLIPGGITLLIALLTISFQAIKAGINNPIKSIKYE